MKHAYYFIGILAAGLMFGSGCQKKGSAPSTASRTQLATPTQDELTVALEKVKAAPNFENYTALGLAYVHQKRPYDALLVFEKSVELNPKSDIAYNNVCSQQIQLHEWKYAKESCEKALQINPKLTIAVNNMKDIQSETRQLEQQVIQLEKTVRTLSGAKLTDANLDLGYKHFELQNYDKAIQIWSKVPRKDRKYSIALNNLASANIALKKFDVAKKQLDEAQKLDPKNPLIENNRRWLQSASQAAAK